VQPEGWRDETEREDAEVEALVVLGMLGALLVVTVVQVLIAERRSRQLQWDRFTDVVRGTEEVCRRSGWVPTDWSFRPGYRWGRGSVTWRKGVETHVGAVTIDALETTRAAVNPWQ
jgi:hypothetical protein